VHVSHILKQVLHLSKLILDYFIRIDLVLGYTKMFCNEDMTTKALEPAIMKIDCIEWMPTNFRIQIQ
jgi:hypothetical protein